jgi:hypothetical protein
MTTNNWWRVRPFVRRIKEEWGQHPSDVIGMLRAQGYRWVDIARMLHTSQHTIQRYIRKEDLGYQNITPEGMEARRENARRLNERMRRGEVRRGGFANCPLGFVTPAGPDSASRL